MGLGLFGKKQEPDFPYQDLVEGAHDVIIAVHAASGFVLYANPSLEKLTGYSPSEVVGKPFSALCEPAQVLSSAELIADAWEKGGLVSTELNLLHKDQTTRLPVEISTRVTRIGTQPGIILYVRDIRERLQLTRLVAEKNEQLLESIRYARYLQLGALPPADSLFKISSEHFLLYLPRDIVSGDFYWIAETSTDYLIAVGDCTGHGVPGAMMVMLCLASLNEASLQLPSPSPGALLTALHQRISQTFFRESIRDGADIVLVAISKDHKQLRWAAAHRPLWIWQGGQLLEYKGERFSIGGFTPPEHTFSEQTLALMQGQRLYLTTDGFGDQFSEDKKKFTTGRLKRLLSETTALPIRQQGHALHEAFLQWKGQAEQMDDVLILGLAF